MKSKFFNWLAISVILPAVGLPRSRAQTFQCTQLDERTFQIDFRLQNLRLEKVAHGPGEPNSDSPFSVIPRMEKGFILPVPGAPMLPVAGFSLVSDQKQKPDIAVVSVQQKELSNIVVPSFPDTVPPAVPVLSKTVIEYTGMQLFQAIPIHNFRVHPFRLNKNTRKLTYFVQISVRISFRNQSGTIYHRRISPALLSSLKKIALNVDKVRFRELPSGTEFQKRNLNSWYNPANSYLKVLVSRDGIYHLNYDDLITAGFEVNTRNPQNIICYFKGEPYPILIRGEADGHFDSDDYIEFYGERNQGLQQYYNDYSDTSVYWFTFATDPGRRIPSRAVPPRAGIQIKNFYHTEHREEDHFYYSGDNSLAIFNSDRSPGEGWIWERIYAGDEYQFPVVAYNYADSPVPDSLRLKVRGITDDPAVPDHHLEILVNNRSVANFFFEGVGDTIFTLAVPKGIVKLGQNTITLRSLQDTGAGYDAIYLDWFELKHPRVTIASDDRLFFSVNDSLVGRRASITITNFHHDSVTVYSLNPLIRLTDFQLDSVGDRFVVSFTDSIGPGNRYLACGVEGVATPDRLVLDRPSDLRSPDHQADYLVITHRAFWTQANDLAQFRQESSGLTPLVVDIEDILDEFHYGMMDPLAIRSFLQFAVANWQPPALQYVLLFGDASWDFKKNSVDAVKENYVPTYGNPVSDARLVSLDGPDDFLPDLFVGRIPVENSQEAAEVVAKIKSYQTAPFSSWYKNVILLNGGFDDWEQNLFKAQAEEIIRRYVQPAPFGGNPVRIYKETNGFVLGELRGEIIPAINTGALWLSFLGHAGSETWDLMLRNEDIYELANENRYPFITSMTCHTARFANPVITSFGELFFKIPDRGAIAFWGTTGWGYIFQDKVLINKLFQSVFAEGITSLGEAITVAKMYLWNLLGDSQINRSTIDQYTLLGDPAQKLRLPPAPDFSLAPNEVKLLPEEPTGEDSVLHIQFPVYNFGLVPEDSIWIDFEVNSSRAQTMPISKRIRIAPPLYRQNVTAALPLKGAVGESRLTITVDPENRIPEIYEQNNRAEIQFYIYSTTISLAKPQAYSVIQKQQPWLQVYSPESSGEAVRTYFFELDTVTTFDSPFRLTSGEVQETVIVTRWQVPVTLSPGSYFWRCRMFNGSQFSRWLVSNFTVVADSTPATWRQDARTGFPILQGDHLTLENRNLGLARDPQRFVFLEVQSAGYEDGSRCYLIVNYQLLKQTTRGHHVVVVDSSSGKIIAGPASFDTYADSTAANRMADFILSQPDHVLILIGIKDEGSFSMTERAYSALEAIGSRYTRKVGFRDSWAMIGRKNALPGTVPEVWKPRGEGSATVRDTLRIFYYSSGTLSSGEIGPATSWKEMGWDLTLPSSTTHFLLQLMGLNRRTGDWELLRQFDQGASFSLRSLPPAEFPKIRLALKLFSEDGLYSPVFHDWWVSYEMSPDFTTHPNLISLASDSILEGIPLSVTVPIYNVGLREVDSIAVQFECSTGQSLWDSLTTQFSHTRLDDSVQLRLLLPTAGYPGERKLRVWLDPKNQWNELSETNNHYTRRFFVETDSLRPEIRILFDDREILPGELVSEKPLVRVEVKDNSPLAIQDTALIRLSLDGRSLFFARGPDQLEFNPGPSNLTGSSASVIYRPVLKAGSHTLEVLANDATRNPTYARVDFVVEDTFALHRVLNVPNPFDQETDFTYILTQPADQVTLSIFTLAGRQILKLQGLPGNTGFNSFHWDGHDADGDEIANGVYLYQIKARSSKRTATRIGKFIIMK